MKPGTYDDTHAPIARKRVAGPTRPGGRAPRSQSSLVLGVLVLAAVVSTRWVRVNVSPSAPLGLYRLAGVTAVATLTAQAVPMWTLDQVQGRLWR